MGKITNDGRRLTHDQLTELRKRGVKSVQEGESPEVVAKALGINRVTIYGWLTLYRKGGWGALEAKRRGGRPSISRSIPDVFPSSLFARVESRRARVERFEKLCGEKEGDSNP